MLMLRRRLRPTQDVLFVLFASLWLSLPTSSFAQDPFDCKVTLDGGKTSYDLTTIADERVISRTRVTPPTSQYEEVRFNLCADLTRKEGVDDGDQVCLQARLAMFAQLTIDFRARQCV